jgi:hypothetical protein
MRHALQSHPQSRSVAVTGIEVEAMRSALGDLMLRYVLTGDIAAIRLPPERSSARTDELWRHTCFEAFLRASGSSAYYEFNFAPSTEWAAYRFSSYRNRMGIAEELAPPRIKVRSGGDRFTLEAVIGLHHLPLAREGAGLQLGFSAVVEEVGGLSYWALTHPPGKPDFHHSGTFTASFPPMAQA